MQQAQQHSVSIFTRRYYVLRHSLHPLKDVGLICFRGTMPSQLSIN